MLKTTLACFTSDTRGAVAILWGLLLPVIIGLSALGVEVGMWYSQQRDYQTAADAAVLAAAYTVSEGGDATDMATAAQNEAEMNGFTVSGDNTITISTPPTSGAYAGNSDYIEVSMTAPSTLMFASLFLDEAVEITVRAVAVVAATSSDDDACVLALNDTDSDALKFRGNASIDVSGCVVASNSSDSTSITISGSATLTAESLQTVGDYSVGGSATLNTTTDPTSGASAVDDPYADLEVPSYSGCDQSNYSVRPSDTTTITPASSTTPYVFCGDLTVQGDLTLSPGIYIIDEGDFDVRSTANLTGSDVTIILTSSTDSDYGTMTLNGSATLDLSAPDSGDYSGMLIYRDRDAPDANNSILGGANAEFTGAIYMPSSTINFTGNSATGGTECLQVIGDTVDISGTTGLTSTGCEDAGATLATLSGANVINLVE